MRARATVPRTHAWVSAMNQPRRVNVNGLLPESEAMSGAAPVSENMQGAAPGAAPPVATLSFQRYDVLVAQGDRSECIIEIIDGTVMLCRAMPDGRRQILELLGPGALLGSPLYEQVSATARAVTRVRVRVHPAQAFDASPLLQSMVVAQLGRRLAMLHELALALGRKTASERVAGYLLQLSRVNRPANRRGTRVRGHAKALVLTQTDLADHLGISLETVSRELSRLKRDGVITLRNREELTFVDPEKLAALAEERLPPKPYRPHQPRMQPPRRKAPRQRSGGKVADLAS